MLYAQRASLRVAAAPFPRATGSATGRTRAARRAPRAPCPQAEDDARRDAQQPADHRAREDDPDQRRVAVADDPAQLHLPGVGDHERDQDDQKRYESERPGIEPGVMAVSAKPCSTGLDRLGL